MDNDQQWYELTEQSLDKLNACDGNWQALEQRDRELAALWRLEADMNNGGFLQFFCNWGIECYQLAVHSLDIIGARQMKQIIESAFAVVDEAYQHNKTDIKEYWDIPRYLSPDMLSKLDELDSAWWDYPEPISELGLAVYQPTD